MPYRYWESTDVDAMRAKARQLHEQGDTAIAAILARVADEIEGESRAGGSGLPQTKNPALPARTPPR